MSLIFSQRYLYDNNRSLFSVSVLRVNYRGDFSVLIVCVCVCAYVGMYICMYTYVGMYICVYTCVCMYICMYTYVCTHVYV